MDNDTILAEASEQLWCGDCSPTRENIIKVVSYWIECLQFQIGKEAHEHQAACGIEDCTGLTWEEHDAQYQSEINDYKRFLKEVYNYDTLQTL